ncbi:hypothetical protein HK405_005625, partial [Cladochytrium tenue]
MALRAMRGGGTGAGAGASSLDQFLRGLDLVPEPGELEVVSELLSRISLALDTVLVSDILQGT